MIITCLGKAAIVKKKMLICKLMFYFMISYKPEINAMFVIIDICLSYRRTNMQD